MTLSQIAFALNTELKGDDQDFSQVSINTRTLEQGDLFIAIKGENFDAHDFVPQAEEKGACALIVEQYCDSSLPQICVNDSRLALGKIASLWRSAFSLPVVAITGSCGKTTVKQMTAAILLQSYKSNSDKNTETVLATRGNLNNDIGMPLTLLSLNKEHKAAVIELGANHMGEIKYLTEIVEPDVALITNAAPAHIEGFGSIDGVAKAKAEIYSGLKMDGIALFNADDVYADFWRTTCQAIKDEKNISVLSFGLDNTADISADYRQTNEGIELNIKTPIGEQFVLLKQFGRHNIYNALAATGAAISAGCSLADVKHGLENFANVSGRLEQKDGLHGATVFDDTYNANPGSVIAGIKAMKEFAQHSHGMGSEIILILGDMAELGEESKQLHYQLGKEAAQLGVKQLLTIGHDSQDICNGFNSVWLKQANEAVKASHFFDKDMLIQRVKNSLRKESIVLIKGSRSMAMETVVDALLNKNVTEGIH